MPLWLPRKTVRHTTDIATPAVMEGLYRISASTVRGPLDRWDSDHASTKDSR